MLQFQQIYSPAPCQASLNIKATRFDARVFKRTASQTAAIVPLCFFFPISNIPGEPTLPLSTVGEV